jgi:hypothetical protein
MCHFLRKEYNSIDWSKMPNVSITWRFGGLWLVAELISHHPEREKLVIGHLKITLVL